MAKIKLVDYKPSDYLINHTDLKIDLDEEHTLVTATLQIKVRPFNREVQQRL